MVEQPVHKRPGRLARSVVYPTFERLAESPTSGTEPAYLYLRLSKYHGDVGGDAINRQRFDLIRALPAEAFTIMGIYIDNDPASGDASPRRKGWRQLNADLDAGKLAGARIGVWKMDRTDRVTWRQLEWLERANSKAAGVFSLHDPEIVDTLNPFTKVIAALKAALAEIEIDTLRLRIEGKKDASSRAGFNHGGVVPFGWTLNGRQLVDHHGRMGTRLDPHPIEHPALKIAIDMLLSGHSLTEVAWHWKFELGIVASDGSALRVANIDRMVRSPRLMGYRMRKVPEHQRGVKINLMEYVARYDENIVGACSCHACWRINDGPRFQPGETLHRAGDPIVAAEPVCDPVSWMRLQHVLNQRVRTTPRQPWGSNEWLLTGLLTCGECGGRLYGSQRPRRTKKTYRYRCVANRIKDEVRCARPVNVTGPSTDRWLTGYVLQRATTERLVELIKRSADQQQKIAQDPRRAELEQKRLELTLLDQARDNGLYDGQRYARYLREKSAVEDQILALTHQLDEQQGAVEPAPAVCREDLVARWDGYTLDQRRLLLRSLVEKVVVAPATRNVFDPSRFRVELRI